MKRLGRLGCGLIISLLAAVEAGAESAVFPATKQPTTPVEIAKALGWVSQSICNKNLCGGYYQDPMADLIGKDLPPLTTTPIDANADQSTFHQQGQSLLIGHVDIRQPGREATADQAIISRNATTGQITSTDLKGNVTLHQPGQVVFAESGHMELQQKIAHVFQAIYRMALSAFTPADPASKETSQSLSAWGKAAEVQQKRAGLYELDKTTYTTCSPFMNSWNVSAKKVVLNHDTGRGTAYNALLYIKDIPIFYTPYFNFPIDKRRQSGFLYPIMGTTSNSGFNLGIPYYWNIAPNYDALIIPHYYSKRGLQMNGQFRYLTESSQGTFLGSFLPNDAEFNNFQKTAPTQYTNLSQPSTLQRLLNSSDNRSYYSWQNQTRFNPHWSSNVNYNYVSDDYYFQDFGGWSVYNSQYQLPRLANLNYSGNIWSFNTQLQSYQTLHPINQAAINNPYQTLPEIDLNATVPPTDDGFSYQWNNQFIYFVRSHNPGELTTPPSAARLNLQPGMSWSLTELPGYFTPRLQVAVTHYDIGNQVSGYPGDIQRQIPIFNIDSGLYFDRDLQIGKTDYQQTLEPRVFYLYVPYRHQYDIPLFDSGSIPFTYDSLFLTNRFTGLDRIGDANQVTFAVTSRFLNQDSGTEMFRASVGEIYYFWNRRLQLCDPNAVNSPANASTYSSCAATSIYSAGATSATEKTSPIASLLTYNFYRNWSANANAAWDPHIHEAVSGGMNLQYKPDMQRVFNVGYNYLRFGDGYTGTPAVAPSSHKNDLNQTGFSFAWPIHERWHAVGGWNYNVSHEYYQSFFYGLQYDNCCWAVRLVAGRAFVALNQNNNPMFNNTVYLQWELKGLGAIGNQDPSGFLLASIPGYTDTLKTFKPT